MKHSFILAVLVAALGSHAFGQTEEIINGGFESGLLGWTSSPGANANVVSSPVHSGTSALSITSVGGQEVVYQAITLPPNLFSATLSYAYDIYSVDGIHTPNAELDVVLADGAGNQLAVLDTKNNSNWDQVAGTYHPMLFDLTPYVSANGGFYQIQFWVAANTGGGTRFNIDDVSVQALDITARGPNDNFANAAPLSGTVPNLMATNTYATKEPKEPNHAGNAGGHSLWWNWTAPDWGVVTITTDNSTFDTLLAAYTGTVVSNLTRVAANDNDNGGQSVTSKISFPVSPGTQYKIAVDGKDGATGIIVLNLSFAPDTQAPTVSFTSPNAGALLTNAQVTVQGTAQDAVALAYVQYRLENAAGTNDYLMATGTNRWSATVTNLMPGLNTVRVQAVDMRTNVAAVARTFYYDILLEAKGAYAGLFAETNTVASTNAGYFSATVATKGKFSAKLLMSGHTYSFSGAFTTNGTYSRSLPLPGGAWLTVQLNLDLEGLDAITGTVSSGAWTAALQANRAVYSRTSPAPQGNQKYTLAIQGGDASANEPAGYGFGAVTVDVAGNVKFSGTLGDGTKVSQNTFLSKQGEWPLYLSATAGKEILQGWLVFTNNPDVSDFNGTVSWVRQPQRTKLFPNGFSCTNGVGVVGSHYAFTNGVPVLNLPSGGLLLLEGGNLTADVIIPFSLDNRNKLTSTNKLSLALSTSTGTFKGTVPVPGSKKPMAVSGVLLQKQNQGFGCFLGTNQTGRVTLGQ